MKTFQCQVGTNAAFEMTDEARQSMHDACPGAFRLAPAMAVHPCDCDCHGPPREGAAKLYGESVLPILTAPAADEPQEEPKDQKAGRKRPRADHRVGVRGCEHCGAPTKGRFAPGHDAKLKSELKREGTVDAAVELMIRDWMRLLRTPRSASFYDAASARVAAMTPAERSQFVIDRNLARQGRHATTNQGGTL